MRWGWFLVRRLAFLIGSLLVISIVIFTIMEVIPGDVAQSILGRGATEAQVQALRVELGLDQPPVARYWAWLSGILRGDLGEAISVQTAIGPLLLYRAQNSLVLAACAALVGLPLSIVLGFAAGLRRPPWLDRIISSVAVLIGSLPEFIIAMLLILFLSHTLHWLPATSWTPGQASPFDNPATLVLPVLTLVLMMLAYNLRVTRASVVRVCDREYVIAAELKQLPRLTIARRHIAPNALLPTITVAAGYVGWMVGGLIVIEAVFTYPGIGLLVLSAAKAKDVPLLEATVLLIAAFRLVVNLVADILYRVADPRVRIA